MHVIFQQNIICKNLHWLRYTVNSLLADTPLFRTLAITDKILIHGKSYTGLTGNDSSYYGLSLSRNYGHFLLTKVTILLFRLSIKRTRCTSHVTLLCKVTACFSSFTKIYFKRFLECSISHRFLKLFAQSSSLLHLTLPFFSSRLFRRAQALVFHSQQLLSIFRIVDKFVQSWKIFWVATSVQSRITLPFQTLVFKNWTKSMEPIPPE